MHYQSYKDKVIVASGALHEQTRKYYPMASITWDKPNGTRGVQIIERAIEQFATIDEACNRAIELAKLWIDRKNG